MSYNNYLDGDAAYGAACDFPDPTCVVGTRLFPSGCSSKRAPPASVASRYPAGVRPRTVSATRRTPPPLPSCSSSST